MLEERKFFDEIKKQIAKASLQYALVALCALGAVVIVSTSARQFLDVKFGAVLVAMKRL